jgi:hypothetical protein
MKQPEGLPRLKALVKNWPGWTSRAGLPGGCSVAAGMFEFDDIEGTVRNKILEMEAEWRRSLLMGLDSPAGRRNGSSPEGVTMRTGYRKPTGQKIGNRRRQSRKPELAEFYLKVTLLDQRATPTICPRKDRSLLRVLRNATRGGAVLYLPRRAHHSSPARRRRQH